MAKDIKTKITNSLQELVTEGNVAVSLEKRGIKGHIGMSYCCPIACYLRSAINDSNVHVNVGADVINWIDDQFGEGGSIRNQGEIRGFVIDFDTGRFPELTIEDDLTEEK